MNKANLKQIIRTELSALLSESTNTLDRAYKVYSSSLTSFREIAIKLKDNKLQKFYRELDKLHQRITKHLDTNYEGALNESLSDLHLKNLPMSLYTDLDTGELALISLLKNTRGDRPGASDKVMVKYFNAYRKLKSVIEKHLHNEYPDWDKRMEEDSKTINVRHKTTKKKLDIPDDPDTIKKYKKLGYTLWIGSRGKLNEKSESYREAELKKVAQMTDRNQHLEARHFVAKKGGYTKHVKAYTALIALQDALGHTPRGADQVRSDLDKDLKKYLTKDVDNWKEVWGSL